jgi:hypothetical protein
VSFVTFVVKAVRFQDFVVKAVRLQDLKYTNRVERVKIWRA